MTAALRVDWGRWAAPIGMSLAAALLGVLAGIDPRLAIGAAGGCAFVLIAFGSLPGGLAAFTVITFIENIPVGSSLLSITKLAGALIFLSWLAVITTSDEEGLDFVRAHAWIATALGLFLGWALLSMTWAEDPAAALGSTGRYALDAVLFLIAFTAIRTPRDARRVAVAFVGGALVAAVYGILSPPAVDVSAGRLGSDTLDPNELAALLVAGAALCAALPRLYKGEPTVRVVALSAGTVCLYGVVLTGSRGGLIALGVALVAGILLGRTRRLQVAAASVMIVFGAYFYFAALAPQEIRDRIASPTQGQERIKEGRTSIWEVGMRAFRANATHGVGSGNFPVASKHYLLEPGVVARSDEIIDEPKVAHNSYLEIASELGVVGLALFLSVVGFAIWSSLKAASVFAKLDDHGMELLSLAIAIALIGVLTANFFISEQQSKQLWLLMGMGPALLSMSGRMTRAGNYGET